MNKKEKKATISVDFIITMIILIIGFVILLIFLYNTYWNQSVDRETCHESVILRATLPNAIENYVALKCKTNKFCITSDFNGKCSEFSGEKGINTLRVSSGAKGVEQIEKFYSQELISCWEMMGEGKVSLFSSFASTYGVGKVAPSCVICSRIAFDNASLIKDNVNLSNINVQNYMMTHLMPNKQITYYQYIAGDRGLFDLGDKEVNIVPLKSADGKTVIDETGGKLDMVSLTQEQANANLFKEDSILFMQISAPEHGEALKNSLSGLGLIWGSGILAAPKTVGKITISAVTSWAFWAGAAIAGWYQYGNVAYNRAVSASYCGDFLVGGAERSGCSVVRIENYNPEEISKYCVNIESIP